MAHDARILIVDDDAHSRSMLSSFLHDEGFTIETAADGFKALPKLEAYAPDLLLTDLKMPGMDGIALMQRALEMDRDQAVVLMTGHSAIDSAVTAMRQGAADYVAKPININELVVVLERALERRRLRTETERLRTRLAQQHGIGGIVGSSPAIKSVLDTMLQAAPSRAPVLVTGEPGTGKEMLAAVIHQHSPRAQAPFVKLHCAALTEPMLESELFGHERGAAQGAPARREGRFVQAEGGTLFLDEIGDITLAVQVKLLRFLQERQFERVGGSETLTADVRVIAATHRDLAESVRKGSFREDLYYRLNVVTIEMPPLRLRTVDIPLLAMHFVKRFGTENQKAIAGFTPEALDRLSRYAWPGNVRELENAIERAVILARGEHIEAADLPPSVVPTIPDGMPLVPGATIAELERYAILRTLEHTGGSTSRAAEILGISARTIQYRLQQYQSSAPAKPEPGEPEPR
jgi:DNA-binding NtrC family response regulator